MADRPPRSNAEIDHSVLTQLVEGGGDFDVTGMASPAWADLPEAIVAASFERLAERGLAQSTVESGVGARWTAWHPTTLAFQELGR